MSKQNSFLSLDDHLCFSLYTCSRAFLRLYRPFLDELQITYPQYLVLLALSEKKVSTVKALGEVLDLDSGTLTPMLKRMEAAGLVIRTRDRADERVVTVQLTPEGSNLREKAVCIPETLLQSTELPLEELQTLNMTLKKILEELNRKGS